MSKTTVFRVVNNRHPKGHPDYAKDFFDREVAVVYLLKMMTYCPMSFKLDTVEVDSKDVEPGVTRGKKKVVEKPRKSEKSMHIKREVLKRKKAKVKKPQVKKPKVQKPRKKISAKIGGKK